EYVAFLDADDTWLPGTLARMVPALARDRDCVMIYSDALRIDSDGKPLPGTYYGRVACPPPSVEDVLTWIWNILPSTIVIRRRAYEECGGFCAEFGRQHPQCEDSYFWVRAREHGPFSYMAEALTRYRVPASFSRRLVRRSVPTWPGGSQGLSGAEIARYVENYQLFARLVRERHGARAARLVEAIRREEVNMLTSVALTAMAMEKRSVARSVYRHLLGYKVSRLKTALRMGWACLPPATARALANCLTPRMARFVNGPAHA
ncbi:MAG: glycosyltransferase, partial [Candidatus Binataceae bacterium]